MCPSLAMPGEAPGKRADAHPVVDGPTADDIQPVANETRDRIVTGIITGLPFVGLGVAGWQAWGGALRPSDLAVLAVMYLLTAAGVTVGFHRLLTHRSFKTGPRTRAALAILGSAAIEGPVVSWVADHRKHHAFADRVGDPHSPHVDHGHGLRGALRGFVHAHVGWIFVHDQRAAKARYAPDLLADPVVSWVDRTFLVWATAGLVLPMALGFAIGGSVHAALTGLLWGGLVRMFLVHHVTYSINSICHVFGRRRFETDDESRNVGWLSLLSLGESWHNNHHAFPTSAHHGMRGRQVDPSAWVIRGLEALGLAWDVVRVEPEAQERKRRRLAADARAQAPAGGS